ncbi:MAG: MMPL family transporter [Deltaproteobacteria bacterium]|nr:MMPL family transporter [Deltaproteobacteria bacterium]
MHEKLGRFLLRHRFVVLALIVASTGFFLVSALRLQVESKTIDLFPSDHPYVETFVKYKDIFGGASTVLIQVEVEEGDIFNKDSLAKIHRVTKDLELLPAINNYQVLSIAQRKVKKLTMDPERGFAATPIMWPKVPQTAEEIERVRHEIYHSPRYFGTLVSLDSKAALIVAGFFEKKMDPELIYERISKIIKRESDDNTKISIIGRPVMLGWILTQYPQIGWLFLYTMLAIFGVLAFYFRDVRGILVPILTAVISAIWGLGFLALLGYNFDPLVIVVPFIISARALSHSVQLIERYFEEYKARRDRIEASVATFSGLFRPGMVSIVTDAAGVILVFLTPIPLMQKLAVMGGFWVLSIIVSDVIFNPIFLSFLPAPKISEKERVGMTDRILRVVATWCFGKQRWVVLGSTLVIFVIGFFFARNLVIGDVHPGTPMLWPDSQYNQDTKSIAKRFGKTEIFSVVVEGDTREAVKNPDVLLTMEAFQKHMEALPEVTATSSIADLLPGIISVLHGGDPKWELIPIDPREAGFFLEMIYTSAEPGDLARFVTTNSQNANITLYLKDHKGETLRAVVDAAKQFIDANPMKGVHFRLAGGYGGLLAAINEVVTWHQAQVTILAFSIVFLFCGLAYRSIIAGFLFLVPLLISNYLTYALMGARGIGLDVNALPVVALGVGLGVDYGLYVVDRIKEEFLKCGELRDAVVIAITTAGKAVLFTATTMVAGVAFWTMSFLRFQADMGLLLVFWMVISMLGGLILLPTLIVTLKPRFIVGKKA